MAEKDAHQKDKKEKKKLSSFFGSKKDKKEKKEARKQAALDNIYSTLSSDQSLRHPATYCAPHVKVPGELTVSASFMVFFDPDHTNQHVRETGVEQYQVFIEISDILECGAVAMPVEVKGEESMAYFLQLHVRTLDGVKWCSAEDAPNAWCVVFRLESREELHEVARGLLGYLDTVRKGDASAARVGPSSPNGYPSSTNGSLKRPKSNTSIPFPCLDCVQEVEAAAQREVQERNAAGKTVEALTAALQQLKSEDSDSDDDGPLLNPGNVTKQVLTEPMAKALRNHLPATLRIDGAVEWVLRYTPKAHGTSLSTLYRTVGDCKQTLLVVQDSKDHIFGGFAPEAWEPHPRFYGSGEAFVFSFGQLDSTSKPISQLKSFSWSCDNNYFMHSDETGIAMGGGNGSHAVFLASDLLRGFSGPTGTFGNPVLASTEEFIVKDVEIWAFEEV